MERNYKLKHPLTPTMDYNTVGSRTFQPGDIVSCDEEELSDPVVFKVGKTFHWKAARSEFLRSIGPVEPGPPSTAKDQPWP